MALLFNDTFTDVAGTDVVAHTSDSGHGYHYGNYTTTPVAQRIGSNHAVYNATSGPTSVYGGAQNVSPVTPASGNDYASCTVWVRTGSYTTTTGVTAGAYMGLDPSAGGPGNLGLVGGYGVRWEPTNTVGDGTWNIRRANDDLTATMVLFTSAAAAWFASVGTTHTSVLLRTAISGGVRLRLYVDGVLLTTVDDTSTKQITRIGTLGYAGGGSASPTTGVLPTRLIAANPAANVAPPSISGTAQAGQTLTGGGDTWSDTPFAVTYQWQQDLGAGFVDITGATGATYVVQPADVGHPLRVTATASGPGGVASASSSSITPTGAPTLVPTDIEVQLSGGTSNTDPRLSIGGPRGAVRVVDPADTSGALVENLLPRVLGPAAQAGQTDYILIYLHNKHAVYGADCVAWIATQPSSSSEHLAIGAPTQPAGQDVPAIATNVTAPSGVTFSAPADAGSGVALGTIPPGSYRGLWIRRVTDTGAPQSATPVTFELRVTVTQV